MVLLSTLYPKISPQNSILIIHFFHSHVIYTSQIWRKSKSHHIRKLVELQGKALKIINFLSDTAPLRNINKNSKILKLPDYITLQNTLLIKYFLNEELRTPLNECFKISSIRPGPLHKNIFSFLNSHINVRKKFL